MGRLEPKHWMLIAGFLGATAAVIGGLDHWADLMKPAVVAGFLGQLSVLIGAVFAGAPQNPNHNDFINPGRRMDDPQAIAVALGEVSEATRSKLP